MKGFCKQLFLDSVDDSTEKTNISVRDVFILGNHSTTQVAYIEEGAITLQGSAEISVRTLLSDPKIDPGSYNNILRKVQNRLSIQ